MEGKLHDLITAIMQKEQRGFSLSITLGELLTVLSLVGGMFTFATRYEGRLVTVETQQGFQDKRLDKLEAVAEETSKNQTDLIQLLKQNKP